MICQNCHEKVDNDLIFCTNCGERISGTLNQAQTVSINDSQLTKILPEKSAKTSSNIKWIALIVALLAIPASIFGVYLLMNSYKNPQIVQNTAKSNVPTQTPSRKNTNQYANLENTNKNINSNANLENTNSNLNANTEQSKETEIINERIEIYAKSSYAKSFEVKAETAKIIGDLEVLQGENIKGFVYLQTVYDEHFPDENFKMFSFGEGKKSVVDMTLVKENYVLVIANDSDKSVIIKSKIVVK